MKRIIASLTLPLVIVLSLVVSSCLDNDEDAAPAKPGAFVLSQVKDPNDGGRVRATQTTGPIKTDFILGDLKASKEFYFVLGNSGDNPIFDVRLTTDNAGFTIAPSRISKLSGENSEDSEIIPLISLGVVHGVRLNGIGFTDVLPMDENSAVLTITGKTVENGDTVLLQSDFNFKVNAKVMDITLAEGARDIDLLNPTGFATGVIGAGGLGYVAMYRVTSSTIKIKNTGNVDIALKTTFWHEYPYPTSNFSLPVGETLTVELPNPDILYYSTHFALDSDGTITNNSRIQLGNDGKGHFLIEKVK